MLASACPNGSCKNDFLCTLFCLGEQWYILLMQCWKLKESQKGRAFTSMTPFSLIPKDICQFPSLPQMLRKVSHPITGDFDKFSWSKVHDLNRNIHKLVRVQCGVWMTWHVKEHITAIYWKLWTRHCHPSPSIHTSDDCWEYSPTPFIWTLRGV